MNRAQRRKHKRVASRAREASEKRLRLEAERRGRAQGVKETQDRFTLRFGPFTGKDGSCDEPYILGVVPERPVVEIMLGRSPSARVMDAEDLYMGRFRHEMFGTRLRFEAEKHVIQYGNGQRVIWYGWKQVGGP